MGGDTFPLALRFTLKEEGGYVDNRLDHGGATNHGITQATYDAWRDGQRQPRQGVQLILDGEVEGIYRQMYWVPGRCEALSPALALCHFDWCVNHGVKGAVETLQQLLRVTADGIFGPGTAAAVAEQDKGTLWQPYNALRRSWYQVWVSAHPDQAPFLKGWLARVDRLDRYAEGIK